MALSRSAAFGSTAFAALLVLWLARAVPAGDFALVSNTFGPLQHIAGLGQIDDDLNGWQAWMEGANALAVELSTPHMTMADWAGNLYIADKDAHAIRKIDTNGILRTIAGINTAGDGPDTATPGTNLTLNAPNGLFVLPDGTLYILDFLNGKVRRLGTDGMAVTVITDPNGITAGRGLWVSRAENLVYYSSGNRIRQWTPAGGLTTFASGFDQLGNLDVDPRDGSVLAADRGAHRVYRVATNGTRTVIAGDGSTDPHGDGGPATNAGLNEVRGVCLAPGGGYFLCTHKGGDVWYVDTNALAHLILDGKSGSDPLPETRIAEPRAVTLAPNGDLLITESDYGAIRVLPRMLKLLEAGTASNGFALAWSSMPGRTAIVERAASLTTTNRQPIAAVPGAPAAWTTRFTDTNASPRAFYRVLNAR